MNRTTRAWLRVTWQERGRSTWVVAAITLGIAAFTAVLSSWWITTRALDAGYLASQPAHATLFVPRVENTLLAALRADPRLAAVEPRRRWSARIRSPKGWRNLVLFAADDFSTQKIAQLGAPRLTDGHWPPAPGELLIERDAFQVAKLAVGDQPRILSPGGVEGKLKITGSVHDVGQAQARMENIVYGYVAPETLSLFEEDASFNQIKIRLREEPQDVAAVGAVVADLERRAAELGYPIAWVDLPEPGRHPHADLMATLLLTKVGFGLLVLLLSAILVVTLLSARMAAQTRQIGILKTLGGTRWQIARIYWSQALCLSAAATLLALPLGLVGGRRLALYLATFLNFDLPSFVLPLWLYGGVLAFGLFFPLLVTAWPVWRSSGVTIRVALADYGVPAGFGQSWLDRCLGRLRFGHRRALAWVWRNSLRQRSRWLRTWVTLVCAGLFFLAALNIRASMIGTIDRLFVAKVYDLNIAFAAPVAGQQVVDLLESAPTVRAAEAWMVGDGQWPGTAQAGQKKEPDAATPHGHPPTKPFSTFALPADSGFVAPEILAGRRLHAGDRAQVVVNQAFLERFPAAQVGRQVQLRLGGKTRELEVVGIARESLTPAAVYWPRAELDAETIAAGGAPKANSFRVSLRNDAAADLDRAKIELEEFLIQAGFRPVQVAAKADNRYGYDQHLEMIYVFLVVMALILAGVGGLGLMTTLSLNVAERRRELAVLRTLGASPGRLSGLLVLEGCWIFFFSWLAAALGSAPFSAYLGNFLARMIFRSGLDLQVEPRGLVIWLILGLALAAAASWIPAHPAARRPIREDLSYE